MRGGGTRRGNTQALFCASHWEGTHGARIIVLRALCWLASGAVPTALHVHSGRCVCAWDVPRACRGNGIKTHLAHKLPLAHKRLWDVVLPHPELGVLGNLLRGTHGLGLSGSCKRWQEWKWNRKLNERGYTYTHTFSRTCTTHPHRHPHDPCNTHANANANMHNARKARTQRPVNHSAEPVLQQLNANVACRVLDRAEHRDLAGATDANTHVTVQQADLESNQAAHNKRR